MQKQTKSEQTIRLKNNLLIENLRYSGYGIDNSKGLCKLNYGEGSYFSLPLIK